MPVTGGLRSGVGAEQIQSVLDGASTRTPRIDRMPLSEVGLIQAVAVVLPGAARKTMPFMLPMYSVPSAAALMLSG